MANARNGENTEYTWGSGAPAHNHSYLAPALLTVLGPGEGQRLLDLGCGNGSLTAKFAHAGFDVSGAESAVSGIEQASSAHPSVEFRPHDITEPLPRDWQGQFEVMVAAEVIEHLFLPRTLFARAHEGLLPGGRLVVSTPFHGYWKNIALAVTNKYDNHWRPGWDYGHVKFFSVSSLSAMGVECGFTPSRVVRVGRIPALAKTMIVEFVELPSDPIPDLG